MTYFDDIDFSAEIYLMEGTFKWEKVEKRLVEMIKDPSKIFDDMNFKDVKLSTGKIKQAKR